MGKEADPDQKSSAAEQEHAEQATNGEAKGLPNSSRHQSETAIHKIDGEDSPTKP